MNEVRKAFRAKLISKCEFPSFGRLFDHGGIVRQCWIDLLQHLPPLFDEIHYRDRTVRILLNIGLLERSHGILGRVKAAGRGRRGSRKRKQSPQKG